MIYETTQETRVFYWNIAMEETLPKGVLLSDYTPLEKEFEPSVLNNTLKRILSEHPDAHLAKPCLMTVTNGDVSGVHVWTDLSTLLQKPFINDPKLSFEHYCED